MANEEYVKETFKPDKLWACKSVTESAFPGITPPEEGGGGGMYQIGEDLNFTPGAYSDGIFEFGSVNGDAFRDAEYKAGAYVVNKGYVFNYIGDSGKQHVFVNVRNSSLLPSSGGIDSAPIDIACDVLAFWQNYDYDDYITWVYTCMPSGYETRDPSSLPSHWNIKVNGAEFYCGKYIEQLVATKIYQHHIALSYSSDGLELEIECFIVNSRASAYTANDVYKTLGQLTTGFVSYGNYHCTLTMMYFTRDGLDQLHFPTAPQHVINLTTGEPFEITNEETLTFLADIVTQI